ncbi:hypothetical protein BDA99DRAFT_564572 [Phascolomyces articulosus]|uniref:Uncharacterized protein n=1 Tax=Phascolomyces articulosus TaxID=60185 RepID=A0AAD5K156_9FUNG|nr:hypothetical protein BDA99DRAFT_564572 [Phascolomyces articulosus]
MTVHNDDHHYPQVLEIICSTILFAAALAILAISSSVHATAGQGGQIFDFKTNPLVHHEKQNVSDVQNVVIRLRAQYLNSLYHFDTPTTKVDTQTVKKASDHELSGPFYTHSLFDDPIPGKLTSTEFANLLKVYWKSKFGGQDPKELTSQQYTRCNKVYLYQGFNVGSAPTIIPDSNNTRRPDYQVILHFDTGRNSSSSSKYTPMQRLFFGNVVFFFAHTHDNEEYYLTRVKVYIK